MQVSSNCFQIIQAGKIFKINIWDPDICPNQELSANACEIIEAWKINKVVAWWNRDASGYVGHSLQPFKGRKISIYDGQIFTDWSQIWEVRQGG